MWKGQLDGNPDVEAELAAADKEGDEVLPHWQKAT